MPTAIEAIRSATKRLLGEGEDLSYITEEELERAAAVKADQIPAGSVVEGNNILEYPAPDHHYEWWEGCAQKNRKRASSIEKTRLVNCNATTMKYRITVTK